MLQYLPEAPCHILDVNVDSNATSEQLEKAGFQVSCLPSGSSCQASQGGNPPEPDASLIANGFAAMAVRGCRFDLVLFQGTAQQMNMLELFSLSANVLDQYGEILILDEARLKPEEVKVAGRPVLKNMLSIAKRCGFTLNNRDSNAMDEAGETSCAVLKFQRSIIPKWQTGLARRSHIGAISRLFQAIFHASMTAELWQWKYGDGRGEGVIVWKGTQLVSHYGGVGRDAMFFGEPCKVCQNGDVMVAESERGALTRKGPFFLTCATYLELYIGYGKKYLLGYGFPNRRAMKVAERLGLYKEVDTMSEVRWPVGNKWPELKTRIRNIDPVLDREVIQSLWLEMRRDLNDFIVGVRDYSYIRHRYLNHPGKEYHVLLVSRRLGASPCGLIVLKRLDDACELIDVVGSIAHIPLLVDQARRIACRWGKNSLFCWLTTHLAPTFMQSDGVVTDLDISIPCNVWSDGPGQRELRGRWWLMSGDTDFH